jgi:hypothetical protein
MTLLELSVSDAPKYGITYDRIWQHWLKAGAKAKSNIFIVHAIGEVYSKSIHSKHK